MMPSIMAVKDPQSLGELDKLPEILNIFGYVLTFCLISFLVDTLKVPVQKRDVALSFDRMNVYF